MPAFVLEIGTEELPARFLVQAETELLELFSAKFKELGLAFSSIETYSTPRRMIVSVGNLSTHSELKEEVIIGPSVKVAFDKGGRPTRAAEGFVRTHSILLEDSFTFTNEKGSYLAVKKKTGGENTANLLEQICPEIIAKLSFSKKMKWSSGQFSFARPIRWVLALLDTQIIPFNIAELSSKDQTYGHRVHGLGPFQIHSASEFFSIIASKGKIVISSKDRRKTIIDVGNSLAHEKQGKVLWNNSLLDEVQGLCEHPVPILASFDPAFLEIPREVLLTSMQNHQKSFGIESQSGELLPYFLTVLNIDPKDPQLVKKGWEKVLRARLEDARFFWNTDNKTSLQQWLDSLDSVIFLAPLGTMGDKTRRIAELCGWLANNIQYTTEETPVRPDDAIRAGRLSKADLVSEMVKEFDSLQGVMGGIYAERKGETLTVARAIAEQYLPVGPDSAVPKTMTGAFLSMADKADTLVGCFGLGMIPTGAADPYGLRRAALGIARILLEKGLRLDIDSFFQKAQEIYGERKWKLAPDQSMLRLKDFFTLRLKNLLLTRGAEKLFVEATILAKANDPWVVSARLEALIAFSKTDSFSTAAIAFKRASNIIRKQVEENINISGDYRRKLLIEPEEIALADRLELLIPKFSILWEKGDYKEIFILFGQISPFVEDFFDKVMVMSENQELKINRLNLLQNLVTRFSDLADFSALQI